MTDYSMKCELKNVREYMWSQLTGGPLRTVLPMIVCVSMLTAMPLLGLIGWIMTKSSVMLIVLGCALLVDIGIIFFLHLMIKSTSAKLFDAYSKQDGLVCSVSEQQIVIVHDNRPVRTISWDKVTECFEGKTAFFIKEGDSGLFILNKSGVLSGSVEETGEIIAGKNGSAEK